MLLFTLDGAEYGYDDNALDIDEACEVKKLTGLGVREFILGIRLQDPIAIRAMVWLTLRRAGQDLQITDVRFDFYKFMESLRWPDADQAEAVDPTQPEPETTAGSDTGTTHRDDEPDTSERSPSTSP